MLFGWLLEVPGRSALAAALMFLGLGGAEAPDDASLEARQLVVRSRVTFESFASDPKMGAFREPLTRARGVLIVPSRLRGALVVGGAGGSGVLVAVDGTRKWQGPAFYTLGGMSVGLQAGGDASEIVLLVMTDRGVASLLSTTVKLGGDVSVAAGPVGAGRAGETTGLSADLLSFSRAKGLYGGVSVEGTLVKVREEWNGAFYGKPVTPKEILTRTAVRHPLAIGLVDSVAKAAAPRLSRSADKP
jgi:lipid-binding SYLF domain-containing protein